MGRDAVIRAPAMAKRSMIAAFLLTATHIKADIYMVIICLNFIDSCSRSKVSALEAHSFDHVHPHAATIYSSDLSSSVRVNRLKDETCIKNEMIWPNSPFLDI